MRAQEHGTFSEALPLLDEADLWVGVWGYSLGFRI